MYKGMMKTIPKNENMSNSTETMLDYYKDQMLQSIAKETTEQSGTESSQTETDTEYDEVPKTGDTAALWLYVLAMCLSGIGLLIIAIAAKRRTSREKNQ